MFTESCKYLLIFANVDLCTKCWYLTCSRMKFEQIDVDIFQSPRRHDGVHQEAVNTVHNENAK